MGLSSKWSSWLRAVLGVVFGYAVYVGGLMALVYFWFISDRSPLSVAQHVVNGLGLAVLGLAVAFATRALAGRHARAALLAVLALVVAVGSANLMLGVAVEPAWFTVSAMAVVGMILLVTRSRMSAEQTPK